MKKILSFLCMAVMFAVTACNDYDSDINKLSEKISGLDGRLTVLETNYKNDISSLRDLVSTAGNGKYIASVSQDEDGYTITLSDGSTLRITNGKDGNDAPKIGVKADDGVYYWTLGGEWLLDADGNKIKASASDGVTPQLKIEDGYWKVSVDNGGTWTQLGPAVAEAGGGIFEKVDLSDPGCVTFFLLDGTSFSVPRYGLFKIGSDASNATVVIRNGQDTTLTLQFPSNVTEETYEAVSVELIAPDGSAAAIAVKSVDGMTFELVPPTFTEGAYNNDAAIKLAASTFDGVAMLKATLALSDGTALNAARALAVRSEYTVSDIIGMEEDATLTVDESMVVALNKKGFVISDGEKAIYVYLNAVPTVEIGDKVTLKGTLYKYNGILEIEDVENLEVVSSGNEVSYPETNDITSTFDDYKDSAAGYITFTGDLTLSGNFFNVKVNGAKKYTGSVSFPVDELGLSGLGGHNVTLTGYYNGVSGNGKYLNIIAVSVVDNGESQADVPSDVKTVTVAEFLAAEASDDVLYRISGTVSGSVNTTYGNFDVTDETGSVYVYGCGNIADYADRLSAGDKIVVVGNRAVYTNSNTGATKDEMTGGNIESLEDVQIETEDMTVAEAIASDDKTAVSLSDVLVMAKGTKGFIVSDGSDEIYVYKSADIMVGDKVSFTASKTTYGGIPELQSVEGLKVISSGNAVNYPRDTDITSGFDDYSASVSEYITFTGDLSVSETFYNVNVSGATAHIGSIAGPDPDFGASSLSGHNITVTGYFAGLTGNGGKYVNIIATSIKDNGANGGGDEPDQPDEPVTGETATFTKVTSAPSDWSGTYLIVYEDGGLAFDGSLSADQTNNGVSVTVSNNSITASIAHAFTVTATTGGYSVKAAGGKYIYGIASKNSVNYADKEGENTVNVFSLDEDGSVLMKTGTSVMRFNAASDQMRFRYFKEASYKNQKPVYLYKKAE